MKTNESQKSPQRISKLLQNLKNEEISRLSIKTDESPQDKMNLSVECQENIIKGIPAIKVMTNRDELGTQDIQKPIFHYLPEDGEMKDLILEVLKYVMKDEQEFFKRMNVNIRKKR